MAVDFEWQSADHDPCAVGMVKVTQGVVTGKFYSLIKPKVPEWNKYTVEKHGITAEMVEGAPILAQLEPYMEWMAEGAVLVGHNYTTAEKCVIDKHTREGSPLREARFIDTYQLTKKDLSKSCEEYGIRLEAHHDALEDATATALLYMKLQGEEVEAPHPAEKKKGKMQGTKRDSSLNKGADLDKVDCKDNPFFGKVFVVSGFSPSSCRDALITLLRDKLGGTNRNQVNGKTDLLVSHTSQDGTELSEKGSKRKDAIKHNVPYYNEKWLYEEVIVKYGLQEEWNAIFEIK